MQKVDMEPARKVENSGPKERDTKISVRSLQVKPFNDYQDGPDKIGDCVRT